MWLDPLFWVPILSVIVILPCQLLLCLKIRSIIIRLLPLIAFFILTALFTYKSFTVNGWDGIGYLFLALLTAVLFGVCLLCWAIFGIVRYVRKKRNKDNLVK